MPDWFSGHVVANGIRIHYHRTGGNRPPLVLSHGFSDNGLCWTRAAQALAPDYDVIMMDARGHGLSEAPATGYGSEARAADLAGLIQALGLEKPWLIGHSMGAETSAVAAARYPDWVGGAILEDPPWNESMLSPETRAARIGEVRATMLARKSRTLEANVAAGRVQHPTWAEVEFGPYAEAKQQVRVHTLAGLDELRSDWVEIVGGIACPTLLLTADPALGGWVTPRVATELAQRCPRLRVVHIAGAGHSIRRERFELFMSVVAAFLSEVQQ
jgi:N-formylmaleamate deformylase